MAVPPASVTAFAAFCARCSSTSDTTNRAPCSANSNAHSRPSPAPPPVMTTTLSAKRMSASSGVRTGVEREDAVLVEFGGRPGVHDLALVQQVHGLGQRQGPAHVLLH